MESAPVKTKRKEYTSLSRLRVRVLMVREDTLPSTPTITIQSPRDIFRVITAETDLIDLDREAIYSLFLDARNKILGIEEVSVGTLNSTLVHPREVFKGAILIGAAGLIIAHNHPSGDVEPSTEDIELTKRLSRAGDIIGVELLDHVIVSRKGFYSIKEKLPNLFEDGYKDSVSLNVK